VEGVPEWAGAEAVLERRGTKRGRGRRRRHERRRCSRACGWSRQGVWNLDWKEEEVAELSSAEPSWTRAPSFPAVVEDATARVGAAPSHREQLIQVRGEGIEPRGTTAGCVGRGAKVVDVRGHNYMAHDGGGEERVGRLMNKQESAPTPATDDAVINANCGGIPRLEHSRGAWTEAAGSR
jgi:hypothetical protein